MKSLLRPIFLAFAMALAVPLSFADTSLQNWYNDPFIQVRSNLSACPKPLGPMTTKEEAQQESHWRLERGTSCWLQGLCSKPNSYAYDAGIAKSVAAHFANDPGFSRSSLWITVQRRFVWVEGCVDDTAVTADMLDAFVRAEPDVERVIVNVKQIGDAHVPYAVMPNP